MRIANVSGRAALMIDGLAVDLASASRGRFGPDPQALYEQFDEMAGWAASAELPPGRQWEKSELGSPAPAPRQVFAIGLNYREHARESGFDVPSFPSVFTKFATSISGPYTEVTLPDGNVDWEIELVAVIGRRARNVTADQAWSHVAGLTAGQDISERVLQMAGSPPQFSLAKSYPGFAPIGPWLVTADEFENPDDLELQCQVNGEQMQKSRTSDLIFGVPELIERLSAVTPMLPGDVIFTGTPPGIGNARNPKRFLQPGEVLTSSIQGIGELRQTFVR